ncbi:MAG: type VI secretion system tube protein Hcp [Variovorax sp.]
MSSDYFVKMTKAEGESKKEGHDKEIEVLSWAWGLSNASSAGQGGGAGQGKAVPEALQFVHNLDKASPVIQSFCAKGTHIDELKLTARKAGDGQQDYMTITLTGAFIIAVHTGGSGGGDVTETVRCSFHKQKTEYKIQDDKGKLSSGPEWTWDVEKTKIS